MLNRQGSVCLEVLTLVCADLQRHPLEPARGEEDDWRHQLAAQSSPDHNLEPCLHGDLCISTLLLCIMVVGIEVDLNLYLCVAPAIVDHELPCHHTYRHDGIWHGQWKYWSISQYRQIVFGFKLNEWND